jgi:integrase/recombinase XerD
MNNDINRQLIKDYHRYLIARDTGTNYQKDNVKLIHMFAKFLKEYKTFYDVKDSEIIIAFLDTRRKNKEDPNQKWITTWNDYLWRIKYFFNGYTTLKRMKTLIILFHQNHQTGQLPFSFKLKK